MTWRSSEELTCKVILPSETYNNNRLTSYITHPHEGKSRLEELQVNYIQVTMLSDRRCAY